MCPLLLTSLQNKPCFQPIPEIKVPVVSSIPPPSSPSLSLLCLLLLYSLAFGWLVGSLLETQNPTGKDIHLQRQERDRAKNRRERRGGGGGGIGDGAAVGAP
ncbi:hypothetical protein ABZP36_019547 [Zizania latifolia]